MYVESFQINTLNLPVHLNSIHAKQCYVSHCSTVVWQRAKITLSHINRYKYNILKEIVELYSAISEQVKRELITTI